MRISPHIEIADNWKYCSNIIEEACTIVHCSFYTARPVKIRIWKNRITLVQDDGTPARLMHVLNIYLSLWNTLPSSDGWCRFLLVFEPLSKACKNFRIVEDLEPLKVYNIQLQENFYSDTILRNSSDAYRVELKRSSR